MEFIDTHTHNSDEAFNGEEDAVIERAGKAGITKMLQADIDSKERPAMFALCERHPEILLPMLGLYPGSVDTRWQEEVDEICRWHERKNPVAIGEIGLDYHEGRETAALQKDALHAQLCLAAEWDLPVNIHMRDATEDLLDILESVRQLGLRGNLHAFSGSAETFRRLDRLGEWYVGIGGVLTFKKASIAEDILQIPLERILLETDAPYLAPTPLRGTRNESANIPIIAGFLAGRKGCSLEEVAAATTSNARKLFRI